MEATPQQQCPCGGPVSLGGRRAPRLLTRAPAMAACTLVEVTSAPTSALRVGPVHPDVRVVLRQPRAPLLVCTSSSACGGKMARSGRLVHMYTR